MVENHHDPKKYLHGGYTIDSLFGEAFKELAPLFLVDMKAYCALEKEHDTVRALNGYFPFVSWERGDKPLSYKGHFFRGTLSVSSEDGESWNLSYERRAMDPLNPDPVSGEPLDAARVLVHETLMVLQEEFDSVDFED